MEESEFTTEESISILASRVFSIHESDNTINDVTFRDTANNQAMERYQATPTDEMNIDDVFFMKVYSERDTEMFYSLDEARKLKKFLSDVIMRYNKAGNRE